MQTFSTTDHLFALLFSLLENKKQPMHIAGLCLFELPAGADDDFIPTLIKKLTQQKKAIFPFNQKPHRHFFFGKQINGST